MTSKCVILLCHWGGHIYDGPEGISYDKPPSKAIKVHREIKFNELINQIHVAASIDEKKNCIKVVCRYPSGFGKMMKYIPLPITDNDDIEIMFHILDLYQELSNIHIYLEVETQHHKKKARGTQPSSLIEKNASLTSDILKEITNEFFPTDVVDEDFNNYMKISNITQISSLIENDASLPREISKESTSKLLPTNVVSDMIENEDFNTISQIAVVNNEMSNGFETDEESFGEDDD